MWTGSLLARSIPPLATTAGAVSAAHQGPWAALAAANRSPQNLSSLVLGAWEKGQAPQGNECREKYGDRGLQGEAGTEGTDNVFREKTKRVWEGQTR